MPFQNAISGTDVLARVRDDLGEPNSGGRFSDATLLRWINDASQLLSTEVDFPEWTATITSVPNNQEYAMPVYNKILRVRAAGQLCPPTSIPLLTGEQIGFFDQTAANFASQWTVAPAATYPVAGDGGLAWSPIPHFPGRRPSYYIRGGNLGLVPAPLTAVAIVVDLIMPPSLLVANGDLLPWPRKFLPALSWLVCSYAIASDDNDEGANTKYTLFENECRRLRAWVSGQNKNKPSGAVVRTSRKFFRPTGVGGTVASGFDPSGANE